MIHDRPYKRAISHDQAIAELRRHSGTQFDPELVDLFIDTYGAVGPEPDPTVLAMTLSGSAHLPTPLVIGDPAASRAVRRPRRVDASGPLTDDDGDSQTMAADGEIGLASDPPVSGQAAGALARSTTEHLSSGGVLGGRHGESAAG
jgi:hypothetical protein